MCPGDALKSEPTLITEDLLTDDELPEVEWVPTLVVLWCIDEPHRIGEAFLVPKNSISVLGRGDQNATDSAGGRLMPVRQRPGRNEWAGPLRSPRISRDQLIVELRPDGTLWVRNVGRAAMLVNREELPRARLAQGDVIELRNRLLLLVTERPLQIPAPRHGRLHMHHFGGPDAHGIVGETPVIWELRERIGFVSARNAHVLVKGGSGTGKELVANAMHALSERGSRPMVSRNAATFPETLIDAELFGTLIDAELFGNVKDYPNPGMRDRRGLIGEAHESTLFLDEVGELPAELQAHLLRVLDDGEYQRLGEAHTRRSDFRLIAATNRPTIQLKQDFGARLQMHVELPDLNVRREDIPLLAQHVLRRIASDDPEIARRFFIDENPDGYPRVGPALVTGLVRHRYDTHVRELGSLLWHSMASSRGRYLDLTP
ncbi:MAG: sigma 54-interacting transcriptional regulator, partial [Deltaproteobacteria bacterium]|nr:sigma 54-interacting transcriptional regulator [Deltaproteobacteria bacterium]